ncbi:MAG: hypothetical protein KA795_08880 [Burkholderiaceae bacterium]|nr:hypothetical protein [Burkholderiaceae bacterium]
MKRITAFALVSLTCALATAQSVSLKTETGVEAGLQLSGYRYQEPGLMSLSGQKLGIALDGTYAFNSFFLTGGLRHASGNVDYTSNGTGSSAANGDRLLEMRAAVGMDVAVGSHVIAPYAGLGYRVLENDLRGRSSTGAMGYRRKSEYQFLMLGAEHRMQVGEQAKLVTSLEYNHLLSGRQTSYFADISPAYAAVFGNPVNDQDKGHGLRLGMDYVVKNWTVGVFAGYWKIADSKVNTYTDGVFIYSLREPKNDTRELGVRVKYRF